MHTHTSLGSSPLDKVFIHALLLGCSENKAVFGRMLLFHLRL